MEAVGEPTPPGVSESVSGAGSGGAGRGKGGSKRTKVAPKAKLPTAAAPAAAAAAQAAASEVKAPIGANANDGGAAAKFSDDLGYPDGEPCSQSEWEAAIAAQSAAMGPESALLFPQGAGGFSSHLDNIERQLEMEEATSRGQGPGTRASTSLAGKEGRVAMLRERFHQHRRHQAAASSDTAVGAVGGDAPHRDADVSASRGATPRTTSGGPVPFREWLIARALEAAETANENANIRERSRSRHRRRRRRSSSSTSSASGDQGRGRDILRRHDPAVQRAARRRPGALCEDMLQHMLRHLGPRGVIAGVGRAQYREVAQSYLTVAVAQSAEHVPVARFREMRTLSMTLDALMRGDLCQTADVLAQRLRALELASVDGWNVAQHVELIPPQAVTSVSQAMRAAAARESRLEDRLRANNASGKAKGKGKKGMHQHHWGEAPARQPWYQPQWPALNVPQQGDLDPNNAGAPALPPPPAPPGGEQARHPFAQGCYGRRKGKGKKGGKKG